MRRAGIATIVAALSIAGGVRAEVSGPQLPPPQKASAAQQAITLYHQNYDPPPIPKPCRPRSGDEITVCGNAGGRSPDRIPLPAESGPRPWPRTAIGELPRVGIGGSPALQGKGAGLTLSIPFGAHTTPAPVRVSGNAEE